VELLIIRHAKAEDFSLSAGDFGRNLVEKGHRQSTAVGNFLLKMDWVPQVILTSPLSRAQQTAGGIQEVVNADHVLVENELSCGMQPTDALELLAGYSHYERVAIVGHEPDFSTLAEHLIGATRGGIRVRKASVIYFRHISIAAGRGVLEAIVSPKMM